MQQYIVFLYCFIYFIISIIFVSFVDSFDAHVYCAYRRDTKYYVDGVFKCLYNL